MDLYDELEGIKELEEKIIKILPEHITFQELINAANASKLEELNITIELCNMAEDYLGWYWEIERELDEAQKKFNNLEF